MGEGSEGRRRGRGLWLRWAAWRRRTQWVLDGCVSCMRLKKQLRSQSVSPAEGELLFEIDDTPLQETLTSCGGLPLFLRAVSAPP